MPQGNGEKLFAKSLFCDDIDNVNGSIKVYYDENCNYLYDEDVIAPFNTSMKVILAYTSSQKILFYLLCPLPSKDCMYKEIHDLL